MKKGLLMISSTSIKGGGPEHMFKLGDKLSNEFRIFYAIPVSKEYKSFLNKEETVKKLPVIEPLIKLKPIMKLKGNSIVSLIMKFTLSFFTLF